MATLKRRLYRKNSSGTYDTVYLETDASIITGTLPVSHGGTGRSTLTSGYFLRGNGTSAVTMSTVAQVKTALGIDELKTSVSEGKSLIAAAVTDKGVQTAADDTFQQMATNIGNISTGLNMDGFNNCVRINWSSSPIQFSDNKLVFGLSVTSLHDPIFLIINFAQSAVFRREVNSYNGIVINESLKTYESTTTVTLTSGSNMLLFTVNFINKTITFNSNGQYFGVQNYMWYVNI